MLSKKPPCLSKVQKSLPGIGLKLTIKIPQWHYLYHFWFPKTLTLNRFLKTLTMNMTLIFMLQETVISCNNAIINLFLTNTPILYPLKNTRKQKVL